MTSKGISDLPLQPNERAALEDLKNGLKKTLADCDLVLFGSRARGEGDAHSDLDVLILVPGAVDRTLRETINDISYPIELRRDVVFGKIIRERKEWSSPLSRALPIYAAIDREGVPL